MIHHDDPTREKIVKSDFFGCFCFSTVACCYFKIPPVQEVSRRVNKGNSLINFSSIKDGILQLARLVEKLRNIK